MGGAGAATVHLFGEPLHRAGLPYGLGGLRCAALFGLLCEPSIDAAASTGREAMSAECSNGLLLEEAALLQGCLANALRNSVMLARCGRRTATFASLR